MTIPSRGEVQLVSSSNDSLQTNWGIEEEGILRTFFLLLLFLVLIRSIETEPCNLNQVQIPGKKKEIETQPSDQ